MVDGRPCIVKKIDMLGLLSTPARKPQLRDNRNYNDSPSQSHLVAIGSSSGGPAALVRLLSRLPADYHSPILVLQHIDAQFAPQLGAWLNEKTALTVQSARDGDCLERGYVYLAAKGNHLMMNRDCTLYYNVEPLETYYRPSVDVLFHSIAKHWDNPVTAVLLTGMGQDGAHGLLELRQAGAYTIAQDEQTSAVYGMPKAAVGLGAAVDILSIQKISDIFPAFFPLFCIPLKPDTIYCGFILIPTKIPIFRSSS